MNADFTTFARQSIFYLMLVVGPIIALDTGRDITPRLAYALVGVIGTVAAVGFAIDWLSRRGVTALSADRIVVSSLLLPALAFALAVILVSHSTAWSRVAWLTPTVIIPLSMLITGTRTNLVIFGALLAVVGRKSSSRVGTGRLAVTVLVAGGLFLAAFPAIASVALNSPEFIEGRLRSAISVLAGQGQADQSFVMRAEQYSQGVALFSLSPVLGLGLGYFVPIILDSPLMTLVRLGWLGTLVLLAYFVALCRAVWISARSVTPSPAHTAWWGLVVVGLLSLPFGTPFEDRGLGFAVILALTGVASCLNAAQASAKAPQMFGATSRNKP
ncbi:hypothetical protein FHX53_001754 [Yonghaparkia alkaliphila]|uniref:Uncharacterized protein n=2 Tax=Microcella alkalica TaxID=355930 RepID=A0A839EFQ8_9MICO|nr:hypothetical protein [Microcella alkalica]